MVPPAPLQASAGTPNLTCLWPCRSPVAEELGKGSREATGSETGCFGDRSHTRHPGRGPLWWPQPGAQEHAELGDSPAPAPPKPSWRKSYRWWLSPWVCSCLSPAPLPPPGQLCPWGDSDTAGGDTPAHPGVIGTFGSQGQVILEAGPIAPTPCERAKPCEMRGHPELGTGLMVLEDLPAHRPAPRTHPVGRVGFGGARGPAASAPQENHGGKADVPTGPGKPSSSGRTSTDDLRQSKTPVTSPRPHPEGAGGGVGDLSTVGRAVGTGTQMMGRRVRARRWRLGLQAGAPWWDAREEGGPSADPQSQGPQTPGRPWRPPGMVLGFLSQPNWGFPGGTRVMLGVGPAPRASGTGVWQSHGQVPRALPAWGRAESRGGGDTCHRPASTHTPSWVQLLARAPSVSIVPPPSR